MLCCLREWFSVALLLHPGSGLGPLENDSGEVGSISTNQSTITKKHYKKFIIIFVKKFKSAISINNKHDCHNI